MRPALRVVAGGRAAPRPRARPRVHTVGSTRDDVVALQTRLKDLSLATALAVEACKGLSAEQQAAWATLAKSVLQFVSTDPGSINTAMRDQGLTLAAQLAAWGDTLRAAGCQAPIPAPIPLPAPPGSSGKSIFDFSDPTNDLNRGGGLLDRILTPIEIVIALALFKEVRDLLH